MALTILVQLWAHPGHEQLLIEYEDQVLRRLAAYGARVMQRVRVADAEVGSAGERDRGPFEAHVLEFPSDRALAEYMADPERLALSDLRDRAIARTELLRVNVVDA